MTFLEVLLICSVSSYENKTAYSDIREEQSLKISKSTSKKPFQDFIKYCAENNIIFVDELKPKIYSKFRSTYSIDSKSMQEIKELVSIADKTKTIDMIFDSLKARDSTNSIIHVNNVHYKDYQIEYLGLSTRTCNCLKSHGINSIGDLLEFPDEQLKDIRSLGILTYYDIKKAIRNFEDMQAVESVDIKSISRITNNISQLCIKQIDAMLNEKPDLDTLDLDAKELDVLKSIEFMIKKLGIKSCQKKYCDLNKDNVDFIYEAIFFKYNIEWLEKHFDMIDKEILKFKPELFIYAFEESNFKILELYKLIEKCDTIGDLNQFFNVIVSETALLAKTKKFIDFLLQDISHIAENLFDRICVNEQEKTVIQSRAAGGSLKDAGILVKLTGERVRQIEIKVIKRFNIMRTGKNILLWICAIQNSRGIVKVEHLIDLLPNRQQELLYLFKSTNDADYNYHINLDSFVFRKVESEIKLAEEYVKGMIDFFFVHEKESIINTSSTEINIDRHLVELFIDKAYIFNGKIYYKYGVSLDGLYSHLLEKFYPQGTNISRTDILQLKFTEVFGNIKYHETTRKVNSRIINICILCARGTYLHPNHMRIPIELTQKIDNFIQNSPRNTLTYLELFEEFKEELLLNSTVNNRYYLQGVIKYFFKDKYLLSRDYVSKNIDSNIDDEIYKFIRSKPNVSRAEIRSAFNGITDTMLNRTMQESNSILLFDNGIYSTFDKFNLNKWHDEIEKIIKDSIAIYPISSRKFFEVIQSAAPDFLEENAIDSHSKLFYILRHMFSKEFSFYRPFIGQIAHKKWRNANIIERYVLETGLQTIKITELKAFCREHHFKFQSWIFLFKQIDDILIRIDSNQMIRLDLLDINEHKIKEISDHLLKGISAKGYLSLKKIDSFEDFPDVGVAWTSFLLKSIVQKFISKITILHDSYFITFIFIPSKLQIDNYEIFLPQLLKDKHSENPFSSIDQVKDWLLGESLAHLDLPKFLTVNQHVCVDESNNLIIQ